MPSLQLATRSSDLRTKVSANVRSIRATSQAGVPLADIHAAASRLEDMCADIAEGRAQEWSKLDTWIFANQAAEYAYMKLIEAGCKPQEARAIVPLDCNTELVHTAFISDWKHFFDLRALGTTGAPHPDAKVLALPLMEEFKAKGYLK